MDTLTTPKCQVKAVISSVGNLKGKLSYGVHETGGGSVEFDYVKDKKLLIVTTNKEVPSGE